MVKTGETVIPDNENIQGSNNRENVASKKIQTNGVDRKDSDTELSYMLLDSNNEISEVTINDVNLVRIDKQVKEIQDGTGEEDLYVWKNASSERIQKDLMNERKRTKKLEEKLQSVSCNLQSLKENGEQRIACLQEALHKAEMQTQLALKSRDLALSLAHESKDEIETIKLNQDKLLTEMTSQKMQLEDMMHKNSSLSNDCERLKFTLRTMCKSENKTCAGLVNEVRRITNVVKQKQDVLEKERDELKQIIAELTNMTNIQSRKLSDLTCICERQKTALQDKDKILYKRHFLIIYNIQDDSENWGEIPLLLSCDRKNVEENIANVGVEMELHDTQCTVKIVNCECNELRTVVEQLKHRLNEEIEASGSFKKKLTSSEEQKWCNIKIKDKIIENQEYAIKRQKKLLQNSQKMAQQLLCEFGKLRDEFCHKKRECESLRVDLNNIEMRIHDKYAIEHEALKSELQFLKCQKEEASLAAKIAGQKLMEVTNNFERQLECQRRQNKFLTLMLWKKNKNVEC